jgi:hypothetical protein
VGFVQGMAMQVDLGLDRQLPGAAARRPAL